MKIVKNKICVLTILIILVIIGLHKLGVVFYSYKGETVGKFQGIVVSDAEEKQYKDKYIVKVNGKKFILYTKKQKEKYKIGDKIEFIGDFEEGEKQRNYGGFDYNLYLKTKKIYGIFNASNISKCIDSNNTTNLSLKNNVIVNNVRSKIKNISYQNMPKENASLLVGLLIGDKTNLSEETIENFRSASLSHILAISGAHFSYIILMLTYVSKKLKRKRIGQIVTLSAIIFFIELTGKTPSVIRAGIMSMLYVIASLLHRKNNFYSSLALSLLIQIIFNPYVIFDIGLILSYSGVLGIVLLYRKVVKILKSKTLSVTISANIILIPIMIYNFNTFSLSFILSNIVATYLLGPLIILGYLSTIFRFKIVFFVLQILSKALLLSASIFSKLPFSKIYVTTPSIISIVIYYAMIYFIFKYGIRAKRRKGVIAVFLTLLIISNLNYEVFFNRNNLLINFIDVGQGDSTLIREAGKTIMIDSGGSTNNEKYDIGKNTLLPYLLDRKIKKIDYIMISHFDADHCQGFMYVMKNLKVKNAIICKQGENSKLYQEFLEICKLKKVKIIYVKKGDIINIGKLKFEIFHPDTDLIQDNILNNNAIVARLTFNNTKILFTGDIEKEAEEKLVKEYSKDIDENNKYRNENNIKYKNENNNENRDENTNHQSKNNNQKTESNNKLEADILKVAHHGSKTSSTQEFLNMVKPKVALIGVGKNNKFGHPSNTTIEKLNKEKCKIYRTDNMGEISIIVKNNKVFIHKKLK